MWWAKRHQVGTLGISFGMLGVLSLDGPFLGGLSNLKLRPLLRLPCWVLHSCVKVDGVVKKSVNSWRSAPEFSQLLPAAQVRV